MGIERGLYPGRELMEEIPLLHLAAKPVSIETLEEIDRYLEDHSLSEDLDHFYWQVRVCLRRELMKNADERKTMQDLLKDVYEQQPHVIWPFRKKYRTS
jgi:hypothetical protein